MSGFWIGFTFFSILSLFLILFALSIIKQDREREKQEKQNLNKTK